MIAPVSTSRFPGSVQVEMAPRSAILIVFYAFIINKCITAVPLDQRKIDYGKVNRDFQLPTYPFEPDLRLKTSQILQAHEVLRLALQGYLDLKDTNLTYYLNAMRKKNESYLDEFGKEIKSYRAIFSLILKQVDEVENNNYAVSHFEGDKYDLCSISKYLSHQRTFSDRQNIIKKMGDAIGTKCDPSMLYKRKIHGDPCSSENRQLSEKQCLQQSNPIVTEPPPSYSPVITISDEKYLEKLCNRQSLDVRIRNSNTKEFLYAAADDRALDEERRRVFTWKDLNDIPGIKGNAWTGEETWRIEPVDQCASNSFRVKSIRNIYGPREYLFANSSDRVYVRRGLTAEDYAVLTLGSSAKWQLLVKVADELRGDYCNLELRDIQGFVLRNEKYAAGYLNADIDDISTEKDDETGRRRNARVSVVGPSHWDILPISTYHPEPAIPRVWKEGPNGTKWDLHCDFKGNNIVSSYIQNVSDSECMDRCIANDACTHWTYSMSGDKKCYIKKSNDAMLEMYHANSQCGFVSGRSWQSF